MFKSPDNRLSASNSAVVSSTNFLIAMTLHSEARSSPSAVDALNRAFEETRGFVLQLSGSFPGLALLAFDANVLPLNWKSRLFVVVKFDILPARFIMALGTFIP